MKQETRAWMGANVSGMRGAAARSDYPERPIDMRIPFGAAGTTDMSARTMSAPLGGAVGKPHVMVLEDDSRQAMPMSNDSPVIQFRSPITWLFPTPTLFATVAIVRTGIRTTRSGTAAAKAARPPILYAVDRVSDMRTPTRTTPMSMRGRFAGIERYGRPNRWSSVLP